ncbi:hypothetical protein [Streptomyces sp. NRRL S-350]|uniref:hypothetical protein n=1 Tax=Streptomyces sp. NRRL S-350 TaxID=1463902 RepID=UPI000AFCC308|nr:hypothetical protein [Streptomyces sp. NRRL S-350]
MKITAAPSTGSVPGQRQSDAPSKPPSSLAARAFAVQQAFTRLPGDVHSLSAP